MTVTMSTLLFGAGEASAITAHSESIVVRQARIRYGRG
jgi:hypothetical protein